MEKYYQVTGFRKGNKAERVAVIVETTEEAEQWVKVHRAENKDKHAYQILTRYLREDGWQLTTGYYLVNGVEVNELVFLGAVG